MTTTALQPGVTTDKIDAAIHHFIVSHGAYPSPLLYQGFPKSCCTSVNNILTHGIPDEYVASASTSLLLKDHFLHRCAQPSTARGRYFERRHHSLSRRISWRHFSDVHGRRGRTSPSLHSSARGSPFDKDGIASGLIATTQAALKAATSVCGPGKPFRGIAQAIHDTITARGGHWCVSPQFTGHGIGRVFHRPPWILHDRTSRCRTAIHRD